MGQSREAAVLVGSVFDRLPDSVASLVLSKLHHAQPIAVAACVSRRWRMLARNVESLTFESFHLFGQQMDFSKVQGLEDSLRGPSSLADPSPSRPRASALESIVTRMLLRTTGLRFLRVAYHPVVWPWIPDDHFSEAQVCAWLLHVASSLEHLALVDPNRPHPRPQRLAALSRCPRLKWLNFCYGTIPSVPAECAKFESLQTLSLDLVSIADTALAALVALAPALSALTLNSCSGLRSPVLVSGRLRTLAVANELADGERVERLTLHCPQLQQLSLVEVQWLVLEEGSALQELSLHCHVRVQSEPLPSLRRLRASGGEWQHSSLTEVLRLSSGLHVLQFTGELSLSLARNHIPLSEFVAGLPELRQLQLGADAFAAIKGGRVGEGRGGGGEGRALGLMQLRHFGGGEPLGALQQPLPSGHQLLWLEEVTLAVHEAGAPWMDTLWALVARAPRLRALRVDASRLEKGLGNAALFSDLLAMQRAFPRVAVAVTCPDRLL